MDTKTTKQTAGEKQSKRVDLAIQKNLKAATAAKRSPKVVVATKKAAPAAAGTVQSAKSAKPVVDMGGHFSKRLAALSAEATTKTPAAARPSYTPQAAGYLKVGDKVIVHALKLFGIIESIPPSPQKKTGLLLALVSVEGFGNTLLREDAIAKVGSAPKSNDAPKVPKTAKELLKKTAKGEVKPKSKEAAMDTAKMLVTIMKKTRREYVLLHEVAVAHFGIEDVSGQLPIAWARLNRAIAAGTVIRPTKKVPHPASNKSVSCWTVSAAAAETLGFDPKSHAEKKASTPCAAKLP